MLSGISVGENRLAYYRECARKATIKMDDVEEKLQDSLPHLAPERTKAPAARPQQSAPNAGQVISLD